MSSSFDHSIDYESIQVNNREVFILRLSKKSVTVVRTKWGKRGNIAKYGRHLIPPPNLSLPKVINFFTKESGFSAATCRSEDRDQRFPSARRGVESQKIGDKTKFFVDRFESFGRDPEKVRNTQSFPPSSIV